jgi:hypothetical protein
VRAAARLRLFALADALATVLYHRWSWLDLEPATLPLVAALAVLVRPGSRACLGLLVALQLVCAYLDLPGANTNRTLMVFVSATLLGAWVLARARAGGTPSAADWQRALEPALRWELLLVYAWAAWHKLNPDYLDVETSCAVQLWLKVVERAPLSLPTGPLARHAAVYGSLLVEAALPLLLLARRTRIAGLALAATLHFVLGLTLFYDFSMTMLALLTLFLPPGLALRLEASLRGGRLRVPGPLVRGLCVALLAVAGELFFWDLYDAFALAWWGLPPVLAWVAWKLRDEPRPLPPARELMRAPAALAPFPLLVFLNGLCPYVGAKTETAFAMYSNLRTEGGSTNHLLVPPGDQRRGAPLRLHGQRQPERVHARAEPLLRARPRLVGRNARLDSRHAAVRGGDRRGAAGR